MTDIKDYLHLYLGCQVETYQDWGTTLTPHLLMKIQEDGFKNIKPILRPLSSMMDEEYDWLSVNILDDIIWSPANFSFFLDSLRKKLTTKRLAETTAYLLSKHFDLFGLIDAGLAIAK